MDLSKSRKALKGHLYYPQFGRIHFVDGGTVRYLSPSAMILLSQLFYWDDKKTSEQGVYKTREEWEDETGISTRRIDTARAELLKASLITEHKEQFPVKIYYNLNLPVLEKYLEEIANKGFVDIECDTDVTSNTSAPPENDVPDGWTPSQNLILFRKAIYDNTTDYAVSDFFTASGTPVKYWYYVDGYIDALLRGEFVARFGKHFKETTKEIPALSLKEIIDIALATKVLKAKGKPNVNDIFWVYGGKFSRFVNKYYQNKPQLPDLKPENVAKWREQYSYLEDPSNFSYGIRDYFQKIKGLSEHIDYVYSIMNKVFMFYDDSTMQSLENMGRASMNISQRKTFIKFWLASFLEYNENMKQWKKESKWSSIAEWISATTVGSSDAWNPWYITMEHIYRTRGWALTENKTALSNIKKRYEQGQARKQGGY